MVTARSFTTQYLVVEQGAVLNMDCLSMNSDEVAAPHFEPLRKYDSFVDAQFVTKQVEELHNEAKSTLVSPTSSDDSLLFQFFKDNDNE